ncbi:MAG: hypothetical protein PHQ23_05630 [Candidatus Wallbacteria bacterium]|nr:hypothetical protein [Candidatus Wallbacteria bacterium]
MRVKETTILLFFATLCYWFFIYRHLSAAHADYLANSALSMDSGRVMQTYDSTLSSREVEVKELISRFLPEKDLVDFGYKLGALCEKSGLTATEVAYKEAVESDYVRQLRFVITLTGEYARLREFIFRIEKDFPFVVLDSIDQLGSSREGSVNVKFGGGLLILK